MKLWDCSVDIWEVLITVLELKFDFFNFIKKEFFLLAWP